MYYNVAQLLKQGVGASRRYALEGELLDFDENNSGSVHVQGDLLFVRIPRGILVTGKGSVSLVQTCRRCLELTTDELSFEIEEEFIPSIDMETGASLPITDDDEPELVIDEQHILDLTEVIRQYVVTQSMGLGLCRVDCKGLCPTCGQNLNEGRCSCETSAVDPRLAKLAALLQVPDEK